MVVVTTLMLTHKIEDCLSACIFPSEGGSAKSSLYICLRLRVKHADESGGRGLSVS